MNKREKGKIWESKAADYLVSLGYKIVERNWVGRWSEIDLIAVKDGLLVFIEVKYRSSFKYGSAEESLTYKKRCALRRSICLYLNKTRFFGNNWSFDLICFNSGEASSLMHYRSLEL